MSTRGWYLPRCSKSSDKLARRSAASTAGSIAAAPARLASNGLNSARPRPKEGFLPDMERLYGGGRQLVAANHLAGERQVGERAARFLVVKQRGFAETRRLGQAHVARNDG